jgi:hypothetical protein
LLRADEDTTEGDDALEEEEEEEEEIDDNEEGEVEANIEGFWVPYWRDFGSPVSRFD